MSDEAIKTVVGEIMRIAVEHGYEGTQIKTITGAIDALADTLAGSDVDSGQTVAQAVRALAPYIGSGGGGSLGALQLVTLDTPYGSQYRLYVATTPFDFTGDDADVVMSAVNSHADVFVSTTLSSRGLGAEPCSIPSGTYVAVVSQNAAYNINVSVSIGPEDDPEPTEDFSYVTINDFIGAPHLFFTMQIPNDEVLAAFTWDEEIDEGN